MTSSEPLDVAIIGGGIAGLTFLLALTNSSRRINCHLYESALAFAEIGAGVGIGLNAQRAMSQIDPAIRRGYDAVSCENLDPSKRDMYFVYRFGMDGRGRAQGYKAGDVAGEAWGKRSGHSMGMGRRELSASDPQTEWEGKECFGMNIAHRAHFLDQLIKIAPHDNVSFGKRVVKIEQDEKGVLLHFADGSQPKRHSVAVACDGIKSDIRRQLFGHKSDARFSGKYTYRGLLPMEKARELLGSEEELSCAQNYIGHGGHILTMPIEEGKILNVVAFRTAPTGKWEDSRWVVPLQREQMMEDFKGWSPNVQKILSLMQKPDTWALFEHPPVEKYWQGKICLVGDAAHASTPHQGAGAGMAIEDAYVLSELLTLVGKDGKDGNVGTQAEWAFEAYDTVRRERTQKLVKTSREAGETYELHAEGIEDDMEKFNENMHVRYDWIWDEDVREEVQTGTKIFEGLKVKNGGI